jgi:hypothetical protein
MEISPWQTKACVWQTKGHRKSAHVPLFFVFLFLCLVFFVAFVCGRFSAKANGVQVQKQKRHRASAKSPEAPWLVAGAVLLCYVLCAVFISADLHRTSD